MSFKKVALIISFLAFFTGVFIIKPPSAQALTASEIQTEIQIKWKQIAELQTEQAKLLEAEGVEAEPAAWCHDFNVNLRYNDRGTEVEALQTALKKENFAIPDFELGHFWGSTNLAVVSFQEKYASEILAVWGRTRGTGFVGKSTRAKLNKLYGCRKEILPGEPESLQEPYKFFASGNSEEANYSYVVPGWYKNNTCIDYDNYTSSGYGSAETKSYAQSEYTNSMGNLITARIDDRCANDEVVIEAKCGSGVNAKYEAMSLFAACSSGYACKEGMCLKKEPEPEVAPEPEPEPEPSEPPEPLPSQGQYKFFASGNSEEANYSYVVPGWYKNNTCIDYDNYTSSGYGSAETKSYVQSEYTNSKGELMTSRIDDRCSGNILIEAYCGNGANAKYEAMSQFVTCPKPNVCKDGACVIFTAVDVLSPNGEESWRIGNTYNITWSFTRMESTDQVLIYLWKDAKRFRDIASGISNSGSYVWTIPSDIPAGDYKIVVYISPVTSLRSPVIDISDNYFSIVESPEPEPVPEVAPEPEPEPVPEVAPEPEPSPPQEPYTFSDAGNSESANYSYVIPGWYKNNTCVDYDNYEGSGEGDSYTASYAESKYTNSKDELMTSKIDDRCFGTTLIEAYCQSGSANAEYEAASKFVACPDGSQCQDGACAAVSEEVGLKIIQNQLAAILESITRLAEQIKGLFGR